MSLRTARHAAATAIAFVLAGCGNSTPAAAPTEAGMAEPAVAAEIPASLAPIGPYADGPCQRLGESAATSNWLDDSAVLVGCPGTPPASVKGTVVGEVSGVTIVSVPMGDANPGMASSESGDALVAGTDYNATTIMRCGFGGKPPTGDCKAGIKRNWGEAGKALVEVTKPDGSKRALFFDGTTPTGADSAQADGSAGWDFSAKRQGDQTTITFGPESYVVVDAMIEGG